MLYAYSIEEANALTTLPDAPQHEGLLFQEWNYSLEDIQSTDRTIDVGANYITDDGKTRLYISIPPNSEPDRPPARNVVSLYISQTVSDGVTIDWGDNSPPVTLAGVGNVNTTNRYAKAGDYVITLDPTDGCILGFGWEDSSYSVFGDTTESVIVYSNMLSKVEIGRNVTKIGNYSNYNCFALMSITIPNSVNSIGTYAFGKCHSLASVIIPSNVTTIDSFVFYQCYSLKNISIPNSAVGIGERAFSSCYSLKNVIIPNSVTNIGNYAFIDCTSMANVTMSDNVTNIGDGAFSNCKSLKSVIMPENMTNIGNTVFGGCYSLSNIAIPNGVTILDFLISDCYSIASITIPDSVNRIEEYSFAFCYGMKEYHFKSAIPPILGGSMVFLGIPSDCIIYVPVGSLSAYQTATNWATYASQIKEEGT